MALCAASALAQPRFKVTPTIEAAPEMGNVNILVIQTDRQSFELRPPAHYAANVHQNDQSIAFVSDAGNCVITVRLTTNYAGTLPKMEHLRDTVARKYPTGSLVRTSTCHSGCGGGLLFDIFQPISKEAMVHIRDGFVSVAEGSFEFTFSCDARDYEKNRLAFAWMLNSFRLRPEPAKNTP